MSGARKSVMNKSFINRGAVLIKRPPSEDSWHFYRSLNASARAIRRQFEAGAGAAELPFEAAAPPEAAGNVAFGSVAAKIAAPMAAISGYCPAVS